MDKKLFMTMAMAHKTLDYEKDPNPENWRTISGAKVHLDQNGEIDGGAGSHGLDMPEDLNILHAYKAYPRKG